jgi:NAD(P)-dependent dehydrogenase (short-subunit alcohol dehydrogenase family)
VVAITGASSGIGRAAALRCARRGSVRAFSECLRGGLAGKKDISQGVAG